ncbi:MAG: fluoride efflux transporter CrcB [Saprospiraceae bacterium]|nr:fluoride efflux transporter CrcB [Saprospiraceae bacterium]
MKEFIAIFLGSGLGGILRYSLSKWVDKWFNHHFPFGTFIVNILACFILGLVIGLAEHRQLLSPNAKMFLAVGFCGGFSTFSTFSSENLNLLQNGNHLSAIFYIFGSVIICVIACFLGIITADWI